MPKRTEHEMHTPVLDATNAAIAAASHLTDMDKGALEAVRALALKIDVADEYLEALADYAADKNLRPPSQDNVSIPTYLKFCESLGLTPAGRAKSAIEGGKGDGNGSTLGKLRLAHGKKGA